MIIRITMAKGRKGIAKLGSSNQSETACQRLCNVMPEVAENETVFGTRIATRWGQTCLTFPSRSSQRSSATSTTSTSCDPQPCALSFYHRHGRLTHILPSFVID